MTLQPVRNALEIANLRSFLDLDRASFGRLFGVSNVKVGEWERNERAPAPAEAAMMALATRYRLSDDLREELHEIIRDMRDAGAFDPARKSQREACAMFLESLVIWWR